MVLSRTFFFIPDKFLINFYHGTIRFDPYCPFISIWSIFIIKSMLWTKLLFPACLTACLISYLTVITFSRIVSKFPSRTFFNWNIFDKFHRQQWLTLIVQLRKFDQFLSKAQMVQTMLHFPRCLAPSHEGTIRLDPYYPYKDDIQIFINSFKYFFAKILSETTWVDPYRPFRKILSIFIERSCDSCV